MAEPPDYPVRGWPGTNPPGTGTPEQRAQQDMWELAEGLNRALTLIAGLEARVAELERRQR